MTIIERAMESKETTTFMGQNALYCQASFNSDGFITLRNYDVNKKDADEIILLSGEETHALIDLFKRLYKTFETQMPF